MVNIMTIFKTTHDRRRDRQSSPPTPRAWFMYCLLGVVWLAGEPVRAADDAVPERAHVALDEIDAAALAGPATAIDLTQHPDLADDVEAVRAVVERGAFAEAALQLDELLNEAPGPCYELLYLLGRTKLGLGRYGEGRVALEQAAVCRPEAAQPQVLLGRLHRTQGRRDQAIAHFQRAVRTPMAADARDAEIARVTTAWFELGETLEEAGYRRAAAEAFAGFDRAVAQLNADQQARDDLGVLLKRYPQGLIDRRLDLLTQLGRRDELISTAREALERYPDRPGTRRLYARTLVENGAAGEAFAFCRAHLQAPADEAAERDEALALLPLAVQAGIAAGEIDAWLDGLVLRVQQGARLRTARLVADRLYAHERPTAAARLYAALAEHMPENAEVQWSLALTRRAAGDRAAAEAGLVDFLSTEAGRQHVPPMLMARWMDMHDTPQDAERRPDVDHAGAADAPRLTVAGMIAVAAGQVDRGADLLTQALDVDDDYYLARVALGQMHLARYDWHAALGQADEVLTRQPDHAPAHFIAARAYEGLDRDADAETEYQAALEADATQLSYLAALARHYRRMADMLAAQRYFQQAWYMDRSRGDVAEDLVDTYLEGGKLEIARMTETEAAAAPVPEDALRRIRTQVRYAARPFQDEHLAALQRQFSAYPDDVQTGLRLATGLLLRREYDEADAVVAQVKAQDPNAEGLMRLEARIALRRLEMDKALRVLEELAERYPRRKTVLALLSDARLADFQIEAARDTMQALLELDLSPEQREGWRTRLLGTYLALSEFEDALALTEDWIAADGDNPAWGRAKLRALLAAGRAYDAVDLAVARLRPAAEALRQLRAEVQSLADRYRAAPEGSEIQAQVQDLQQRLEEVSAVVFQRRTEFVQVCLEAEEYEVAEHYVRNWLQTENEQPGVRDWLIEVLIAAGKQAEAQQALQAYTPRDESDVLQVYLWQARVLALGQQVDPAVNQLTELLNEPYIQRNDSARAQLQQQLVALLVEAENFDAALEFVEDWLADVDEDKELVQLTLLSLKRFALQAAGREDDVMHVTAQMLEINPNETGLLNDLGYTWADRGIHLEQALDMIRQAVADEPLNAAFLDSLGWVYYKQGDFESAELHLSRAVRLREGQDPVVYDHLGDARYRLGDEPGAREAWSQALELIEQQGEDTPGMIRTDDLGEAIQSKLEACEDGRTPNVAPTSGERPAHEELA